MDPQGEIPTVLDDAAGGVLFGFFLPSSWIPFPYCSFRGWKGLHFLVKGAATVAVCSAIFLALRQCYKRYNRRLTSPSVSPLPSTAPSAQGFTRSPPVRRRRKRKLLVVPSPANRSARTPERFLVTPGPSSPPASSSSSPSSTRVATIRFRDSDSDEDSYGGDLPGPVEEQVRYTPVVLDQVASEADDESSELEEVGDSHKPTPDTGFDTSSQSVRHGDEKTEESDGIAIEQLTIEVSEFSLTFETESSSDSLDPDSELVDCDTGLKNKSITVTPSDSSPAEQGGITSGPLEPRRVSLDQLSESLEDGAVVTQAIVTIG